MEKNILNQNTLIPAMHECARLDMESQVYMLRNTETKRPKTQCAIHNMSLAYLATKIKGEENKRTYVWPATQQADTEQKAYNKVED